MRNRLLGAVALVAAVVAIASREALAVAAAGVATSYWLAQADLSRIRGFPGAPFLRRAVRMLLPLVFLLLLPVPDLGVDWTLPAAVVLVLLVMIPAWRDVRDMLDSSLLEWMEPITTSQKVREVFGYATGGAAQELVYRYLVLTATSQWPAAVAVALSAVLFVGEHVVATDWRERYDTRDLATHAVLGAGFAALTVVSGSVLGALVAHTLYNFPALLQAARWPTEDALPSDPEPAVPPTEPARSENFARIDDHDA